MSEKVRECKDCIHSEFVYHFDDINMDSYGCLLFGLYDDDVRGEGDKCGPEGKFFEPKGETQ